MNKCSNTRWWCIRLEPGIIHASLWRHNGSVGVTDHQPHDCLLNRSFWCRSKKTSKLRVTGLYAGNAAMTGEFPAQMASNAENVSIWWRHHVKVALRPAFPFSVCFWSNLPIWVISQNSHSCHVNVVHLSEYRLAFGSPSMTDRSKLTQWRTACGHWNRRSPITITQPLTTSSIKSLKPIRLLYSLKSLSSMILYISSVLECVSV